MPQACKLKPCQLINYALQITPDNQQRIINMNMGVLLVALERTRTLTRTPELYI